MSKNIVLIGLMGSGKTTLGKYIAQKTKMKFIDTDELIIQKASMPIGKIFEEYGELYFRDLESEVIEQTSQKQDCVISTGGGAVLRDENIENLKKTGILFHLEASPEELYSRIKDDNSRPLLKGDNPSEILRRILIARKPFYEQADFKINTENRSIEEISAQVLQHYKQHL